MSADVPQVPQPVLEYATRNADGLPDFVPEAEALIDAGQSPQAIRKLFRKPLHAVRYFGKSMSRRYGAEALTDACVACGEPGAGHVMQLEWSATCPPRFLEFRVSEQEIKSEFTTMHALCDTCMSDWIARLTKFAGVSWWLTWARRVLVGLFVLSVLLSIIPIVRSYTIGIVPRFNLLWFLPAYFAIAAFGSVIATVWRWRHPRLLKRMMPKHVKLVGIDGLFLRDDDGTLVSLTA